MIELKGYQTQAIQRIGEMREEKRGSPILSVAPCGAGKSLIMERLIELELAMGGEVVLLAHRNMLIDQLSRDFEKAGMPYTVMGRGHKYDPTQPIKIVSLQMMFSRCVGKATMDFPKATLVLVDEAHAQVADTFRAIIFGSTNGSSVQAGLIPRGADVVGFTATPLLSRQGVYGRMLQICNYSDLRKEQMHQLIRVYSPDEIDTSKLKQNAAGEYSDKQLEGRAMVIYGSAYREYNVLNPNQLPSILYAPSVQTSRWFAERFTENGISAAHIDGMHCLIPDGTGGHRQCKADGEARQDILDAHREGDIKMICNRFVLREAVNMPWVYHGIFATVMGGVTTYLQSVGRLQRYFEAYTTKVLQCHGGSVWRHGSPNDDRLWKLGDTNVSYSKARVEAIVKGEMPEPIRCPKCGGWRNKGPYCPHCGHAHKVSVRVVRSMNGRLKEITGRVFVAKSNEDKVQSLWTQNLFSAGKSSSKRPVSGAVAIFRNQCSNAGLTIDWSKLRNPPPLPNSAEWHLPVATVYPWTTKARQKKPS